MIKTSANSYKTASRPGSHERTYPGRANVIKTTGGHQKPTHDSFPGTKPGRGSGIKTTGGI